MIKDFKKFLNEKANIDVEIDNPMKLDFTLVPSKESITVVSVKGRFEDDLLDLTYMMSDGNEIELDGYFFTGPPREYHEAKGKKEHVRISSENPKVTYDIDPDYYIGLLEDWGENTFAVLIHGLFYDDMKLQGFKSMPKLDWSKIKK